MKTIRLIELFAGYGSQAMALKRLNLPFEHRGIQNNRANKEVGVCERQL